jgi:ribosomal protein S18 acetylase RimI-like enzyme
VTVCLLAGGGLVEARTPDDIAQARRLFRAYAEWLAVDLCLQGFEQELAALPGAYAPPAGRLLLARIAGEAVGCVGLRPLEPGIAEIKRLWVEPGFGGRGIGRALAEASIQAARAIGYERLRLDTIPARMLAALHLYRALGFAPIPPYYHNPLDGAVMFELRLRPAIEA